MFTILSTYPSHASGNVGDKLLEEQTKNLIRKETDVKDFQVYFRHRDFTSTVERLNEASAIILPAFAIREPVYPDTYRLTDELEDITSPLIPLAANWSHYPGDAESNSSLTYSEMTRSFLNRLNAQDELSKFTARDVFTKRILERHGIETTLVGDLAWYHEEYLGEPMRTTRGINHVVMTTPHNAHYLDQAIGLMDMLVEEFPDSTLTCSFHSSLSSSDRVLRAEAEDRGFEIVLASHDTDNIEFYDDCDLHVGYRLHGHLSFLRRRLPSVLIAEDGRGIGFNETLGIAGFAATNRRLNHRYASLVENFGETMTGRGLREISTNWLNKANPYKSLIAPVDMTVPDRICDFLRREIADDFNSYEVVPDLIDETYESAMKPFLQSLPRE